MAWSKVGVILRRSPRSILEGPHQRTGLANSSGPERKVVVFEVEIESTCRHGAGVLSNRFRTSIGKLFFLLSSDKPELPR